MSVVPDPMVHSPNPAFEGLVTERAMALCLGAPAPSHSVAAVAPCTVHLSDARRDLMGAWLGQQSEVA